MILSKSKLVFVMIVICGGTVFAQERSDFVSDASHIIGTHQPADSDHSAASQAAAANALLKLFGDEQKAQLVQAIDSAERREWTNLPAPANAGGVRMGDMNDEQVQATCELMATLLSEHGYQKVVGIMLADDQLLNNGQPRRGFGTENFSIVVFGTPSETGPWGFQLDGHHVGVNVAVEGDSLCMSPSFIGTQPQSFELAGETIRPLTGEIDDAYKLVNSLTDPQRKQAVTRNERGEIVTGPGNDNSQVEIAGLRCSEMTNKQKDVLLGLISQWVNDLPQTHAEKRMKQIKSEFESMHFEWNGETEVGSDISYRIVSPSLVIEYACQSLGGDPQQHLHTMYRDPSNEYGSQVGAIKR